MINVAELMRDPDFAQAFQVERAGGAFVEGEWIAAAPAVLNMVGIIQPAKREDVLAILPEGGRLGSFIVVFTDQELQIEDSETKRSDVIIWRGKTYRVIGQKPWVDHGFWQAFAEGFSR